MLTNMPFFDNVFLQKYSEQKIDVLFKKDMPIFPLNLASNFIDYTIRNGYEIPSFWVEFDENIVQKDDNLQSKNSISFENQLNNQRLIELEKQFSDRFISYILEDDFESGMEFKAHMLVKEQMRINAMATREWLNKIYVSNFNNSEILIGILRVIARFDRKEIYPMGDTIALASLSRNNAVVQETAIRAFESWGGKESLDILKNATVTTKWVKEYLDGVISDLTAEYVG